MNYTKGPWKTGRGDFQSYTTDGIPFTNIYHAELIEKHHHVTGDPLPVTIGRAEGDNNKANARLMVAAPDLLEACKYAVAALRKHGYKHVYGLDEMEAAIAKAEGK